MLSFFRSSETCCTRWDDDNRINGFKMGICRTIYVERIHVIYFLLHLTRFFEWPVPMIMHYDTTDLVLISFLMLMSLCTMCRLELCE